MAGALTKIQAVIIVLIIVIAAVLSIAILTMQKQGQVVTTTSPTLTETSPTQTEVSSPSPTETLEEYEIVIGNVSLKVSREFKEFVDKVKAGEISVKIYFGHALAEHERSAFVKVLNMFNQEFPGIVVEELPYASMDLLKSQISAIATLLPEQREGHIGKVPDVFTWAHDWIGSFADKGWIIPLEKVLDEEAINEIRTMLLPIAFESVRYKLKTYGLPYAGEAIALIINKKLVDTVPTTFSEMKSIMEEFYDPVNERYGLSLQFDPYHIYPFITAFGGYYYDPGKENIYERFGVNSTRTKQGVEFFIRNVLRYMDYSSLSGERQLSLFTANRTPMIITGPWNLPAINGSIGLENVVIVPIPSIDDKIPRPFSGFRNLYLTIMAETGGINRLYATVLFVLYISLNDNVLKILVDENNYIPVKISVIDYVIENKDKYSIVYGFYQQILRSIPMPNDPLMDMAWGVGTYLNAIIGEFTNAIAAGKSLDEAIEQAVAVINEKLDEGYARIIGSLSG
uniref:Extracellular solute-binding protein n=1 Tax=Staphylothermus marinus TaxID=2280 RepID=A0A7C4HA28_STAMA